MEVLVSVAGLDTSNSAGVTLDVRIFRLFGFHGVCAVTAITYQNSCGIEGMKAIEAEHLEMQLKSIFEDFNVKGIKVGIVVTEKQAELLKEFLKNFEGLKVLDPILVSSTGYKFAEPEIYEGLFNVVDAITPNVKEAEVFSGERISSVEDAKRAAKKIAEKFGCSVVITGKDIGGIDVIYDGDFHEIKAEVGEKEVHGTGCVYSSALLANISLGKNIVDAARYARLTTLESAKRAKKVGRCLLFVDPPFAFD
ncbi:Phosphomethylpyrimidine kinase [Ferroglobus placidus DSM 10642]|uniref:Phosphomethylpyrimidine kinase n=1 Tax=Ferroglobus placidus (strain DSM 10642 / AEDII12DO) TaxID=589924 RepID=D3S0N2_FERPA|nr:hydroxymethylpyrimidine/phosphomethylpyrimidine kinase [Ferroglobus placidus]ADC66273.1 Phosphomethylpyrimidine kinase [Ferroglobus placidus DSM 10642]